MLIIKPNKHFGIDVKELWFYRELFYFLAWRDIKVRYKHMILGIGWAVLQPLLTMVVFTFIFNKIGGISSGKVPYILFSFTGLVFWNYFSSALSDVSNSFVANQSILTKVFFPRLIIPISATIVPVVDFFFSFVVLFFLLLFFHISINLLGLFTIVLLLMLSILTAIGLGGILSILNVKYRDIRYALPFFIQLLLFITPVIYSVNLIPRKFQLFLYINPMTGVIETARAVLFHQYQINLLGLLISIVSSCVLLLLGILFFARYEQEIADII